MNTFDKQKQWSDNLTDENNLIVFRNVQKYIHHSNRIE
jgi:hypothetical protein